MVDLISKQLQDRLNSGKILIRSTNWIGDAIMTTPAVRTLRRNFPKAEIAVLAYPWVADVFLNSPYVDEVIIYDKKGGHRGAGGLFRLGRELAARRFDAAILLQNAFEAALLALFAGIPVRAGYIRDGRGLLLTHGVKIKPEVRLLHQVYYYQELCRGLGLEKGPDDLNLKPAPEAERRADSFLTASEGRPLIGLNPGAAFGPAKCWPVDRYGRLAAALAEELNAVILVFGTGADNVTADTIRGFAREQVVDLTGKTSLAEAMALIGRCDVLVTNDSGLMHVGAALRTPLVAIFGSTDPVATGPFSNRIRILRRGLACQPCFKRQCRTDFECMKGIGVSAVKEAVMDLLVTQGG